MSLPLLALSIDINGIGTVLPSVQRDFDVPAGTIAWLVSTTSLTMAATLMLVGRLAPRLGNRRLVLVGAAFFGVASLLCGLAPNFWLLIAARVGQGLGGVLMFTTSLAVIDSVFDERRRSAAVGAWGVINGVGGALGPAVAGITTTVSWRTFFLINVPLCLVALPVMFKLTPKDQATPSTEPLSIVRLGLLGAALVSLTWAFQNTADEGWTAPGTLVAFMFPAAVFAGLVVVQRRGRDPLLFAGVSRSPMLASANIVAFTANWGFGVTIVSVGIYLQLGLGKTPLESGLVFTTFSIACAVAGLCIAAIHKRLGLVGAMAAGMIVVAGSLLLGAWVLTPSTTLVVVTLFLVLAGFGQGLAFDLSTLAALEDVPHVAAAQAAGVISVVRSMGFTIGIAMSTTLSVAVTSGASQTADTVAKDLRATLALAAGVAAIGIAGAFAHNVLGRREAVPQPSAGES